MKELMQIENRRGPRTEPCGTSHVTLRWPEWEPFTETYCFRSERYDLKIQERFPEFRNVLVSSKENE